jgi:hypothetical protein
LAVAKFGMIPFVTQKSTRCGSLFQYFTTSGCDQSGTPCSTFREKDVVKADFSVLIIMCFERLGGGGDLRILSEDILPLNRGLNPGVS